VSVCVLAGAAVTRLAAAAFTLSWTHSVEKIVWEEDWRVADEKMSIVAARVQGSGAGMEPGESARLENGWWRWQPQLPPVPELVLALSGHASPWRLCIRAGCLELSATDGNPAVIRPCR
jgi:hypothetical protein